MGDVDFFLWESEHDLPKLVHFENIALAIAYLPYDRPSTMQPIDYLIYMPECPIIKFTKEYFTSFLN